MVICTVILFLARLNWFDYKLFHAILSVHRNSIKRLTLFDKDEYLRWDNGLDKFSYSSSSLAFIFEAMY